MFYGIARTPTLVVGDLMMLHGHVYTGNCTSPWVQAILISGSHIEEVGADAVILKRRTSHTRTVDLHGKTVVPGLIDAHVHLLFGAMELHGINLSTPKKSITPLEPDRLVDHIRQYAERHSHEPVLQGRADFSASPTFSPTRELLDKAVPDRPLVIHSTFEHALWVNSKALALAGITDQPLANPDEERNIIRDASGRPTGILIEAAMQVIERAVQQSLPIDEQLSMLTEAARFLNSHGITGVVNATGNLAEIQLLGTLRDRGQLTVRTRNAFGAVAVRHELSPQFLADLDLARTRYHDKRASANLVKFFEDGSTELIPPLVYERSADHRVLELDRLGYQLMTHAERDDSVHMVLNAYSNAQRINGPRDRRLRIEHATVVFNEDIARYASQSVIASMQPIFCCSETGTN